MTTDVETAQDFASTGILFSGPMVLRLLDGSKTQTRRILDLSPRAVLSKGQRDLGWTYSVEHARVGNVREMISSLVGKVDHSGGQQLIVPARHPDDASVPWEECGAERIYPRWEIGDHLWVRETWQQIRRTGRNGGLKTVASPSQRAGRIIYAAGNGWEDPPRWRHSIFMPRWASRITLEITDVRVQRLQDISEEDAVRQAAARGQKTAGPIDYFRCLWDKLNAARGFAWESNPWVTALTFRRISELDLTVAEPGR